MLDPARFGIDTSHDPLEEGEETAGR